MGIKTGVQGSYSFLLPKLSRGLYLQALALPPKPKQEKKPRSPKRTLTDEQVAEMRRLWEQERSKWSYQLLAEKFGVKPGSVGAIVTYQTRAKAQDGGWLK